MDMISCRIHFVTALRKLSLRVLFEDVVLLTLQGENSYQFV